MAFFDLSSIEIGDVLINDMSLHKNDESAQPMNLLGQLQTMSLYEDLMQPVLFADFTIVDPYNILKKFPITGEEHINVDFQTPSITNTYSANLFVYAVTGISITDDDQTQRYTIRACSEELFYNAGAVVEKGYNTTIDQIIKDIMKYYLKTSKIMHFDTTKGIQPYVPFRAAPFTVIETLTKRAAAVSAKSSSFVFYESKDGFHFTTLEDLILQGVPLVTSMNRTYYIHTALRTQLQNPFGHYDIVDYTVGQEFNVVENIKAGVYRGQTQSFDIATKTFQRFDYNASQFNQFASLDTGKVAAPVSGPIFINVGQKVIQLTGSTGKGGSGVVAPNQIRSIPASNFSKYTSQPAMRLFNIRNTSKTPTYIEEFLANKIGYMGPVLTSSYDIYINGDTSLGVGDVISIQVPHPDKLKDVQPTSPDLLTNGNYLITKLRHNILVSALKPKYTAVATIVKGTFN